MCVILRKHFFKKNIFTMKQNVSKPMNLKARRKVLRDALTNAHDYIGRECSTYGISVAELCWRAGVERSHFQRWKRKVPRSMQTFDKLLAQLDVIEATEYTSPENPGTGDVATA